MATRTERVVLELESNIATQAIKDAAAIALLKKELGGLDGSNKDVTKSSKAMGDQTDRSTRSVSKSGAEIDKLSGRLTVLAQVAAGVGPALIPIGAVGIPAVAGLANELAGVGLGAGTALLAFHGLGEGLSALNKAALDPTVSNLQAAQLALEKLPPSARDFARELSAMQPTMLRLREAAAQGLFPGLESSLTELHTRSGEVQKILFRVGSELGDLSRRGAEALSGPEWDKFFKFVAQEAPAALEGLGRATGDVIHGLAQLWMAFTPLNHDFTTLIVQAADGFDRWATGLAKTEGFTDFIAYLRTNGPLVADAVVAIGNAVLKIVEAAAPLGGPILTALTAIANAISTIADSPAGPTILATVTALSLLSRAQATFGKVSSASWVQAARGADGYRAKLTAARPALVKGGLAAAGLALATSGLAEKTGLANTATLALTGSLAGPWGAAAGGAVGLLLDMSDKSDQFKISTQDITDTLNKQTGAITQNTRAFVASQLQQQGVFDAATHLGLNLNEVTSAALGNEDALNRVTAAVKAYQEQAATPQVVGQNAQGEDVRVATPVSPADQEAVDKLNGALGTTSASVRDAKGNLIQLNSAVSGTATGFGSARSAAERFRLEIGRVSDTLTQRADLRDYQQALDDFAARAKQRGALMVQIAQAQRDLATADTKSERQSARDRIKSLTEQADALKNSLNIDTQAGRDTQALLDDIARTALAVAQTMKGTERTHFLAQARKDFIQAAEAAGLTEKAAKRLADRLGLLSKIQSHAKVYVDGIPQSLADLEAVAAHLRALHDKTIRLTTIRTTGGRILPGLAGGGTVPGSRAPYGDKVFAHLAPGEEVISNRYGQADQHRALLKAINARRYADGGTIAQTRVSVNVAGASNVAGNPIDYGRLAQAVSQVRPAAPLYGDVHITGDPTTFKRAMDQDRAMANASGVRRD